MIYQIYRYGFWINCSKAEWDKEPGNRRVIKNGKIIDDGK